MGRLLLLLSRVRSPRAMTQQHYIIPDVLRDWPWVRTVNPHYEVGRVESTTWLESFKSFTPRTRAAFDRCDFGKQYAWSIRSTLDHTPYSPHMCPRMAHLQLVYVSIQTTQPCLCSPIHAVDFRSCCDLMNVFFILEEHTDSLDTLRVQAVCHASKDAVMHPDTPRPPGEHFIGELTK